MIYQLDIDLIRANVIFLIEPTLAEFDRLYYDNVTRITDAEYKDIREEIENPELSDGYTRLLNCGTAIVYLRHKYAEGSFTHEIIHAAYKLLKVRGFDLDDEEAWAYLGGYLTEKYYDFMRENDPDFKSED